MRLEGKTRQQQKFQCLEMSDEGTCSTTYTFPLPYTNAQAFGIPNQF